jgi:pimeloyl-ACP methyl ester carboxylesterase
MSLLARVGVAAALAAACLMPAPASAYRMGSIDFTPCNLAGSHHVAAIAAQCAHFSVAENPAKPEGRRIELRLALVGSQAPKANPDLVTLIAGGPGQSAVDAFPDFQEAFEPLRKHHRILLVDQRGTGGSHPLRCPNPDWNAPNADDAALLKQYTERCRQLLETDADLAQYTTVNAVDDLEAVRQALGAPPLDLIGVSYGTRVALDYLRRHAAGVRSVILDSVVPPEQAVGQENARNLDAALAQIFGHCRDDKTCHERFGDPGVTLAGLRQKLAAAPMRADVADPITGAWSQSTLYPSTLSGIVRLYSYSPEFASLLPLLIDETAQGRPQALLAQGHLVFDRFANSMSLGMQFSVLCAEDAPLLQPRPDDKDTLLGAGLYDATRAQCSVWPRGSMPADFHAPVVSDKPVLLMSGQWDPVTPPRYAEAVAAHLSNSRQVVAVGQGHNVLPRGCLPKLAQAFVEKLDPKTLDVRCIDTFRPTPAFVNLLGAGP